MEETAHDCTHATHKPTRTRSTHMHINTHAPKKHTHKHANAHAHTHSHARACTDAAQKGRGRATPTECTYAHTQTHTHRHTHTRMQHTASGGPHLMNGAAERSKKATSHRRAIVARGMLLAAKPASSQAGQGWEGLRPSLLRRAVRAGRCSLARCDSTCWSTCSQTHVVASTSKVTQPLSFRLT